MLPSATTLRRNRAALPLPAERIQRLWLGTELTSCEEEPALFAVSWVFPLAR